MMNKKYIQHLICAGILVIGASAFFWPTSSQSQMVPIGFWKATGGGSPPPSADTWVHMNYDLPARVGHVAVWTGTKMIIWGGGDSMAAAGYVEGGVYDPATDSWVNTSLTNAPTSRCYATAVWTGTEMIVWGGQLDCNSSDTNTGGKYNPSTDTWTATNTSGAPAARSLHSAIWTGTVMVVWGGGTNTGSRYTPGTDSWSATNTASAAAARYGHTAVWTGTYMVVWGGAASGAPINTGGRYNVSGNSWSALTTTGAPAARQYHTAVWTGTEMIVWGGNDGSSNPVNTGGRYNPTGNSWTATSTTGSVPTARANHVAVWTGTKMIIWGGTEDGMTGVGSGAQYDPTGDSWTATSTTGAAAGRTQAKAVWTGTEMFVWGGNSFFTTFNNGGRYNPSTDSWQVINAGEAGSTTTYSGMPFVWTGSSLLVVPACEMDIFSGGLSCGSSGAKYTPATNTWTRITTTGAPSIYYGMTAVWTGTEMIVWGGADPISGILSNAGGKYNPSTDTWTATSTASAPAGRYTHAAVWTGTKMIIWGGADGGGSIRTGGQYDPSANTWTPTLATGSNPTARMSPGVVWTGSVMIIWGGSPSGSNATNTGGRYNPTGNTWTSITTTGAPSARYYHTMHWTGSRLLVWGGTDGTLFFNDGGQYDPTGNSWTAITTTGAPQARYWMANVWTGTEMIIWGGNASGNYMDTGAKYNPSTNTWTAMTMTNAPPAKSNMPSVWTGTAMVIWGGGSLLTRYQRVSFYYP